MSSGILGLLTSKAPTERSNVNLCVFVKEWQVVIITIWIPTFSNIYEWNVLIIFL